MGKLINGDSRDIILFEIDDWAILEDKRTGACLYEGHNGGSLLQAILEILEVEQVFLEGEDVDREAERTGTIWDSIEKWKIENVRT